MTLSWESLGRRIRELREVHRLGQQDVANHLGISRSAVSLIEAGKRGISGIELARLAEFFGVSERTLLGLDPLPGSPPVLHYRSGASRHDSPPQEAQSLGTWFIKKVRHYAELEALLGGEPPVLALPSYVFPRMRAVEQGEEAARRERRRLNLGDGPIPFLGSVFEQQGIRVFLRVDDHPAVVEGISYRGPYGVAILATIERRPAALASYRWHFTLAHEYAHLLFDSSPGQAWFLAEPVAEASAGKAARINVPEMRANAFAAAFLMPAAGLRSAIEQYGGAVTPETVIQLAREFRVSHTAIVWRLYNLHLISESERDFLLTLQPQELARTLGYEVYEEAGHLLDRYAMMNLPNRFVLLAVRALRQGLLSLSAFAEYLDLNLVEARQVAEAFGAYPQEALSD